MKVQGNDGASHGQLKERIAIGGVILSFYPWGQIVSDRSPSLEI